MAEDLTRPYVGYRSAGRRPERAQDRRAAADAPLAALRGMVSGVLGAPGDVESLVRLLPGLSEETLLPTSEDIERRLPLRVVSQTPAGRAFTTAGQLGGGGYMGPGSPLRAIAALPSAVSRAGREFAVAAGQPAVNVVKPKGGNWLAGSVERAIDPMRVKVIGQDPAARLRDLDAAYAQNVEAGVEVNPELFARERSRLESEATMNRWLETKLAKYIRNEMATPEDPVRALAERGVLHTELPEYGPFTREDLSRLREAEGFPGEGLAQSELGRRWEQAADLSIYPSEAGYLARTKEVDTNPFLLKVPPETMVYEVGPRQSQFQSLGFNHLVDELRNAINPESGLPRELLWKYSDLDKVTVPQAVERVAKINEWRAAQKAEADLMRAQNAATVEYKTYDTVPGTALPNERGLRWVELRTPEESAALPEGYSLSTITNEKLPPGHMGRNSYAVVDPQGRMLEGAGMGYTEADAVDKFKRAYYGKSIEDALKYEGETMGHCVGGYCPDVLEGRSRIFSLRDKKGQPHVTIEVKPQRSYGSEHLNAQRAQAEAEAFAQGLDPEKSGFSTFVNNRMSELVEQNLPQDIIQIKGKANRAPKEEYLPFVQDFVRSQQWGRVGDLENTGLRLTRDVLNDLERQTLEGYGHKFGEYMTEAERQNLQRLWDEGRAAGREGFAAGGLVGLHQRYQTGGAVRPAPQSAAVPYDEAKIDALATALTA